MAIAYDAVSVGNTANSPIASPLSWNHTISGANTVLLLGIEMSGKTPSAVTYNGVAMTLLDSVVLGGNNQYFYGLLNPATGTNSISVSWSGGNDYVSGEATSYTGVKQTGLPDSYANKTQTSGSSITQSTTVVDSSCWIVTWGRHSDSNATAGSGITMRNQQGLGGQLWIGDSNGTVGTGSQSVTVNGTGGAQVLMMVSIAPPQEASGGFYYMSV